MKNKLSYSKIYRHACQLVIPDLLESELKNHFIRFDTDDVTGVRSFIRRSSISRSFCKPELFMVLLSLTGPILGVDIRRNHKLQGGKIILMDIPTIGLFARF